MTFYELLRFHNRHQDGPALSFDDDFFCVCVHADTIHIINLLQLIDPLDERLGYCRWLVAHAPKLEALGWRVHPTADSVDREIRMSTELPLVLRNDNRKAMRRNVQSQQKKKRTPVLCLDEEGARWSRENLCAVEEPRTVVLQKTLLGRRRGAVGKVQTLGYRPTDYLKKSKMTDITCHVLSRCFSGSVVSPRVRDMSLGHLWFVLLVLRDGDLALTSITFEQLFEQSPEFETTLLRNPVRDLFESSPAVGGAVSRLDQVTKSESARSPNDYISVTEGSKCAAPLRVISRKQALVANWENRLREWAVTFAREPLSSGEALLVTACCNVIFVYVLSSAMAKPSHDEADAVGHQPIAWLVLERNDVVETCLSSVTSLSALVLSRGEDVIQCSIAAGTADGRVSVHHLELKRIDNESSYRAQWQQANQLQLESVFPVLASCQRQTRETSVRGGIRQIDFQVVLAQSDRVTVINYRLEVKTTPGSPRGGARQTKCALNYQPLSNTLPFNSRGTVSSAMDAELRILDDRIVLVDHGNKYATAGPCDETIGGVYAWHFTAIEQSVKTTIGSYNEDQGSALADTDDDGGHFVPQAKPHCQLRQATGAVLSDSGMIILNESLGIISEVSTGYISSSRPNTSLTACWLLQTLPRWQSLNLRGVPEGDEHIFRLRHLASWRVAFKGSERAPEDLSSWKTLFSAENQNDQETEARSLDEADIPEEITNDLDSHLLETFKVFLRLGGESDGETYRKLVILFSTGLSQKQRVQILFVLRGLLIKQDYRLSKLAIPRWVLRLNRLLIRLWLRLRGPPASYIPRCELQVEVEYPPAPPGELDSCVYDLALFLLDNQTVAQRLDEISFCEPNPYCLHCAAFLFNFMLDEDWPLQQLITAATDHGANCPFCSQPLILFSG